MILSRLGRDGGCLGRRTAVMLGAPVPYLSAPDPLRVRQRSAWRGLPGMSRSPGRAGAARLRGLSLPAPEERWSRSRQLQLAGGFRAESRALARGQADVSQRVNWVQHKNYFSRAPMKKPMNKKMLLLRNVKAENNNVAPAKVIKVYQRYACSLVQIACS